MKNESRMKKNKEKLGHRERKQGHNKEMLSYFQLTSRSESESESESEFVLPSKFTPTRNLFWHIGADNKHKNIISTTHKNNNI